MESWADGDAYERPDFAEKVTFEDDDTEDLAGGDRSEIITIVSDETKSFLEDK